MESPATGELAHAPHPVRVRIATLLSRVALICVILACLCVATAFALGQAALAANPTCVSPSGHVADLVRELNATWLAGIGTAALTVGFALAARLIAPASADQARSTASATLVCAVIAAVGLVAAFAWHLVASFGSCIG